MDDSMSDLQAIYDRLNDVEATIATLDREGGAGIADKLALASLETRRADLQQLADEVAERQMVDVCDYRRPQHLA